MGRLTKTVGEVVTGSYSYNWEREGNTIRLSNIRINPGEAIKLLVEMPLPRRALDVQTEPGEQT